MRFDPVKSEAGSAGPLQDTSHVMAGYVDEVAEARRCLASVLKSLSGVFYRCELTPPWRMSFVSEGIEELTGYSRADLEVQDGWSDLVDPKDLASVEKVVLEAVQQHQPFEVTYRIKRKDGLVLWVAERGQAIFNDAGMAIYLEGIISDVSGRRQANELERTMISKWRTTLDTIPQIVWTMSADGSDEFYNKRWFEFTGSTVGSQGVDRLALVHPDDREEAKERWSSCFARAASYEAQYRLRHHSGEYRWVLSRGCLQKDANGKPLRWYGTCTEVHGQVLAKQALSISEEINRSIVAASPDCICLLDAEGKLRFMNQAFEEALGKPQSGAHIGALWADLFSPSAQDAAHLAVQQAQAGKTGQFSASYVVAGQTRWWDVIVAPTRSFVGQVTGITTIARDMTRQKAAEERIRWAANHDALTGLPNRTLFQTALDELLVHAQTSGSRCTVLMMDLDEFKRTNDALGHDAGDALLVEFSSRLRTAVRLDDMVARLGGDEFAVILRDVGRTEEIVAAVASILSSLETPFAYDGKLLDIRSTIGASTFPVHGTSRTELLKHADIALYVAKASNKGGLSCFRPEMRAEVRRRMSMLSIAQHALRDDRILPYYQPKFNLRSGQLDGLEALLRWRHTNQRVHRPAAIDAAFKDVSLAAEISERIISCVITDIRDWQNADVPFGHVAVNAGAAELRKGNFAENLLAKLHASEIPVSVIQVEVTETVFLGRGAESVAKTLRTLASAGIRIVLDDFGTGYASLSHLNQFPIHALKIDRSFVSKLESAPHQAAIVRAIIKLGRSLGIEIVAEGVENEAQLDFLTKHRCHHGQGYLFARAQPSDKVARLAAQWKQGIGLLANKGSDWRSSRLVA